MMRRSVFCLTAVLATSALAEAPRLGRLFTTPAERAQLDAQRSGVTPPAPAAPAAAPPPVELNGVVTRSSGRSTIWMDQQPQTEPNNRILAQPGTPVALRLSSGRTLLLKPGQRYDPASGAIHDITAP